MDDKREFDYLHLRITRLEEKMDKMLAFRGWVLGGVTVLSSVVSASVAWVTR